MGGAAIFAARRRGGVHREWTWIDTDAVIFTTKLGACAARRLGLRGVWGCATTDCVSRKVRKSAKGLARENIPDGFAA